ncbi:F-box only protein 6 isoform X2 [Latimeria chalumnae]|uniref:F-box only protein 6 isoform X2 n=1 Tax=Latimeria chalumnae TaxID=7897 RepID=UPI0006D90C1B|nr:PREDICTED: F-box only protein 6 isoform X1 [Latimeria chalumnae]|eukprot:XP_006004331.2 PREDICTED: F-box only protein 6 isoform X1 [Latimeria chalumnae]
MTRIDDLPETVFVQVLSYLPARELVLTCRLVCSLWKSLVDKKILWIRKCQLEGLSRKHLQKQPKDWKEFYFLCHLRRNLIKNPCAEAGLDFWTLEKNRGDCWRTENLPGGYGQVFPDPEVTKYFVTSYGYAARHDCGCTYKLQVQLLSQDHLVIKQRHSGKIFIEQWSDAKWNQISFTFSNYGPGVRYIKFLHGGKDTQFWAGWYGIRVTNSSITIEPDKLT